MKTSQKLTAGIGTMLLAVAATVSVAAIANPAAPEQKSEFTSILYPLDGTGAAYLGPPEQVAAEPQPSIVNTAPDGPPRVAAGQAYLEYLAAIDAMEHPLPLGAEYPDGVPEGLDAGPVPGQPLSIMESGAGTNLAHFTWLCAWESDYLTAFDEKDFKRLERAETMLTAWADTAWHRQLDPGGAWTDVVINPMKAGDPSGVKRDRTDMCAHAGIFNLPS